MRYRDYIPGCLKKKYWPVDEKQQQKLNQCIEAKIQYYTYHKFTNFLYEVYRRDDKILDFANKFITQFLVVISLGCVVDEAWRCERLLNGIKANPKYPL